MRVVKHEPVHSIRILNGSPTQLAEGRSFD
jgi:hypothetical protein